MLTCREFKGKKLREGARHKMKVVPDGTCYHIVTMEVSRVSDADEGEYRALASNNIGQGVATINLHFEGKTASDKPKWVMCLISYEYCILLSKK